MRKFFWDRLVGGARSSRIVITVTPSSDGFCRFAAVNDNGDTHAWIVDTASADDAMESILTTISAAETMH